MNNNSKLKLEPYLFIFLAVILFVVFLLFPIIDLIRNSFSDASLARGITQFVGLENYKDVFNKEFLNSLIVTAYWLVGSIAGMAFFGFSIAYILNKPIPGRSLIRTLVIIPWIVPQALAGVMWYWVVQSHYGILNNILLKAHLIQEPINFLSDSTALTTVIVARIWQGTPFMILLLTAALSTIPKEVEEAAKLDGAKGLNFIRYIILPIIKPTFIMSVVILGAWTLRIFDLPFVMTGGGPSDSTNIISILMYTKAFIEQDLGMASVIGIFTIFIVLLISIPSIRERKGDV